MGYTNNHTNYLDLEMKQTPFNVYAVRVNAGYSIKELSEVSSIREYRLIEAEEGILPLPDEQWREVLNHCGTRAFDYDGE